MQIIQNSQNIRNSKYVSAANPSNKEMNSAKRINENVKNSKINKDTLFKIENSFYALWTTLEIEGFYFSEEEKQVVYDYLMHKITKKQMEVLLDA